MKSNKKCVVSIDGYTDSKGDDGYNMRLANRRVNAVSAYLISRGVSRNRITKHFYGNARPVAPNQNPDGSDNPGGRALNRRVELIIK